MKKIFLLSVLLSISVVSYSQIDVEMGIKFGAKIANGDAGQIDTESFVAFQAGAFTHLKFDKFGLQPEVLWSRQGAEFSDGQDFDLNYINVPIMIKYYLSSGFNLQVGPQFGLLLSSEDEEGESLDASLKNGDFGAAIGIGYDASRIHFSARYIYGLTDISNETGIEFSHRIFQMSIGYSFIKYGK